MKTALFQSCGHCWVFQICWHIECSTFTASSFRIWNSSTRIPSPPLALFVVMLPKAHLTSHSRMSGSRWVITHHRGYQTRLQQYMNCELPDAQAGFTKGRGTREQIANIFWIMKKWESSRKTSSDVLTSESLWLCGSQQTMENSSRDGNTRPPDLPLEKSACRSRSNS